jgi:phospholipid-binding lipoprotein MlaA
MPATERHKTARNALAAGLLLVVLSLPAPAVDRDTAGQDAPVDNGDPLEGFNRAMYTFNDWFDRYIGKPVARGYDFVLPDFAQNGISNFFLNLREPITIVNDLLQGKGTQALSDTGRLVVNTTFGLGGFIDMAGYWELPRHQEDYGQTFARWGMGEGFYIVWPFLGPSTARDSLGMVPGWYTHPATYIEDSTTFWSLVVLEAVDLRAQLLDATDILEQAGGQDPYVFVREAYRQRRTYLIHDGSPPREVPPELFEDEPPAPKGR